MVESLKEYDLDLEIYDPRVDSKDVELEYGLAPISELSDGKYDAIILAVVHDQFREMSSQQFHALGKINHVLVDLKSVLGKDDSDLRL